MNKNIIIGMCMFIVLVASVTAFGVAPSRELISYDTQEHTFTVRVLNNDNIKNKVAIYLNGELAEYAKLETNILTIEGGDKSFKYTIKLPEGLTSGQKTLDVLVAQLPDESATEEHPVNAGLVALHQLKVDIPYPGQFADGKLYVSSSKKGEPLTFTVSLTNKGKEELDATVDIIIKGPTNEQIQRFNLGNKKIGVASQSKIEGQIINDLNPGEYVAEAIVQYGRETKVLSKTFYSGDMIVDINSVQAKDFRLGSVAKFDIEIENKWNQPLDVYADMTVLDSNGDEVNTYKTGTTTINALAREIINAYWDTEGLAVGNYNIKVALNYAGKTNERVVGIVVGINSIQVNDGLSGNVIGQEITTKDNKYNIVIILLIILVVINIGWFVYFKFMRKPPSTP